MDVLTRWPWPGNVRELENYIERAVILTRGSALQAPLGELRNPAGQEQPPAIGTMADAERRHILRALEESRGTVGGSHGAAAMLGMKRTTLQSRMQKLGISLPRTAPKYRQGAAISADEPSGSPGRDS